MNFFIFVLFTIILPSTFICFYLINIMRKIKLKNGIKSIKKNIFIILEGMGLIVLAVQVVEDGYKIENQNRLIYMLNETLNEFIYEKELFDKEFYNNTFGKIIIYYPKNQTGDTRYEIVGIFLNNTLSGGLYNVKFIIAGGENSVGNL
ncbi:MAG TPA: hypothetical protein ENI51_09240, partial [Candidatus Atribacteria bacterium]|nr:hypothetical protein [Candidatus Atribacteria bacterium]